MLLRRLVAALGPLLLCVLVCAVFRWLDGMMGAASFLAFLIKGVLLGAALALTLPLAGVRAVVQRGGAAQGGVAPGTGRGSAAARQRIGRVGQDEMEGIFAAVPQKMRVGKVALPEAAHIFQPQKAGVCRGRSA